MYLARCLTSLAACTSRALVIAAELSDRYITDRFLPDKAIDLVDEACSGMRVQLDSVPEDIDTLQRRVIALQVGSRVLSMAAVWGRMCAAALGARGHRHPAADWWPLPCAKGNLI